MSVEFPESIKHQTVTKIEHLLNIEFVFDLLHDGGFFKELDSFLDAGFVGDCFDSAPDIGQAGFATTQQTLVDHTKGALTQFSDQVDIVTSHFPMVGNIF